MMEKMFDAFGIKVAWRVGLPPPLIGVYHARIRGCVAYVGMAVNMSKRVASHICNPWYRALVDSGSEIQWFYHPTGQGDGTTHGTSAALRIARELEKRLIRSMNPDFNVTSGERRRRFSGADWPDGRLIEQEEKAKA